MDTEKEIIPHITIQKGLSFPVLEKCVTCCATGVYHCPFCSPDYFKPAKRSRVAHHLDLHLKRAIQVGEFTVHKCALDCAKRQHYHCLYCIAMLINKQDYNRHIGFCKYMQGSGGEGFEQQSVLFETKGLKVASLLSTESSKRDDKDVMHMSVFQDVNMAGGSSIKPVSSFVPVSSEQDAGGSTMMTVKPSVSKHDQGTQVNLEKPQDCDEFYFMNLVKMFKKLNASKKTEVRMKIERLLFEAEFM